MQRLDIGAIIRVSLGEVPECVVPGHVVQQLNVPVPVSCLKLMHHKDEILLTNVLSGKPRTEKRQCGQKLSRGVQSLLIVCALRSEKKLTLILRLVSTLVFTNFTDCVHHFGIEHLPIHSVSEFYGNCGEGKRVG